MTIKDYSSTAASNTAINGVSIAGTAPVSNMDDGLRNVMADISNWTDSDTLVSGTTTDLGSVAGMYVTVSGTATITGFGTLKAGMIKLVYFSGAGQITYNATSMILPGSANITRAAGDTAIFVSEGSGNWRCVAYHVATHGPSVIATTNQANNFTETQTVKSTDAGATSGPILRLFRDSASPAASDAMGILYFIGRDSGAAEQTYGSIYATITDPTAGSEDGLLLIETVQAGTVAARIGVGAGMYSVGVTGGDPGAGKLNFADVQVGGVSLQTQGSWSPVVTSSSGSITSYSANGNYTKIGNVVAFRCSVGLTNNGTGAGVMNITLPFTSLYRCAAAGMNVTNGSTCNGYILDGGSTLVAIRYDGNYPGITGQVYHFSGVYLTS